MVEGTFYWFSSPCWSWWITVCDCPLPPTSSSSHHWMFITQSPIPVSQTLCPLSLSLLNPSLMLDILDLAGLAMQTLIPPFQHIPCTFFTILAFIIYTVTSVASQEHFSTILSNFLSIVGLASLLPHCFQCVYNLLRQYCKLNLVAYPWSKLVKDTKVVDVMGGIGHVVTCLRPFPFSYCWIVLPFNTILWQSAQYF